MMSPWLDLACRGESMTTKAPDDVMIDPLTLAEWAEMYYGGGDLTAPLASPLYGDLAGLPPMLIQVGTAEILLDDSVRFVERARAEGVEATLDVWDDMIHVWQLFAMMLPEAQQAIDRIGAFVKELICRFTVWSLQLERRFAFYTWKRPPLEAGDEPKQLAAYRLGIHLRRRGHSLVRLAGKFLNVDVGKHGGETVRGVELARAFRADLQDHREPEAPKSLGLEVIAVQCAHIS